MNRPRLALLLLVPLACSARAPVPVAAPLDEQLRSRTDQDYQGGLTRDDVALAQALADQALATGVPRKDCQLPDRFHGVYSEEQVSSPARGKLANAALDLLESFIRTGNRRQRDVALLAVARIGQGSEFNPAFLAGRGPWSPQAQAAVTCKRFSGPDASELGPVSRLDQSARPARRIDRMIAQMLDRDLIWPDEIFSLTLVNHSDSHEGLTLERVGRLLPVLADRAYPAALRAQVVAFIGALEDKAVVFEGPLLEAYRSRTEGLSEPAGWALVKLGTSRGADVLADLIEAKPYHPWPRRWGPERDCTYPPRSERLESALLKRVDDPTLDVRAVAIRALGCLRARAAIPALLRALEQPFWSQQLVAVKALGRMAPLPANAIAAVESTARAHWSALVREQAARTLGIVKGGKPAEPQGFDPRLARGFHRNGLEHGLPVCHGEEPGDGKYRLPWLGPFEVRWENAKVHDLPRGFPITPREWRDRKDYGTNTFLRAEGGWLYSIDLWHYGGELGHVSDGGQVRRFAPESANAAFILRTQLGITVLGEDVFDGGEGGTLAVVERQRDGSWSYGVVLELPSEAFGHAFAPDGTLLVKDPYGAVAITRDRKLVPLACP